MTDIIIILVLLVIVAFAVRRTIKHFKGGGCCGSGSGPIIQEKKLSGPKLGEKIVDISGMHCDHCVASVTKAINKIEGASASVSLNQHRAVVSYDREISEEVLRKAVEEAGFQVNSIV